MPVVAIVDGVKLYIYPNDHPPPHFHALFAEFRAVFDVETLKMIRGRLPLAKQKAIVRWAEPRKTKLLEAWNRAQAQLQPGKIR